ncbi:ABC transporter substrate-binding protein [Pseudonocardia sp. ICBG601]|uniref:ABC transporter substrate-binding protein n=1 Tax=Pseudonocardia sp. ICBG601 TaxID=2846759 RepID=UPI001CF6597A|nr:ABC transporter substrate-binding protein [Pseudonocardia sp. ICBG601]
MSRIPRPLRHLRLAAVALVLPLVAAVGCSGADPDQAAPVDPGTAVNTSPEQNRVRADRIEAIAATVPAAVRESGKLTVATTGSGNPPLSFRADDDRTVIGVEPDLAQLVADTLGLRLDLQPTSWENLFLGVESPTYDAGFSNITVTEERKDKYDFATYRVDTVTFEARNAGRVERIEKPADISGLTIGVSPGTNQEQILVEWNRQNEAAGVAPATIQYYQNTGDYYLALDSGRLDAYLGPNPGVAYHVATGSTTKAVGSLNGGGGGVQADIAAMTRRGDGLVGPIHEAIDALIASGKYGEVLARWHLENEALQDSRINPPGLPRRAAS